MKNLNLVAACLIALLTRMYSNQDIEVLAGVFAALFEKIEGKDVYQDDRAKNSAGNSEKGMVKPTMLQPRVIK